ncbi:uncharacterized protein EMH_0035350 [Eimeria mitis]|uniref:Uncharacterized protein n=1 Tax=Eimeria mitis TaxID=44415 RepID=U6JUY1_9EIME|nr:uncharacterized protein EMH_0035350 [Eimeria mitis]CDJ27842.1 hypothetical protein EMH_0035350 [Eimeria mitis]
MSPYSTKLNSLLSSVENEVNIRLSPALPASRSSHFSIDGTSPAAAYSQQQPTEKQQETAAASSPLHKQREEHEGPSIHPPLHCFQGSCTRARLQYRPPLLIVAAIISVAAVLILFSVCKLLRSRKQVSTHTPRRLAERGDAVDDDELAVIEDCLALEYDLGLMQQRSTSQLGSDPVREIEGIVSALIAAAEEHEMTQGLSSPSTGSPASSSSSISSLSQESREKEEEQETSSDAAASIASPAEHHPADTAGALAPPAPIDSASQVSSKEQKKKKVSLTPPSALSIDEEQPSTSAASAPSPDDENLAAEGDDDVVDIPNHPYIFLISFLS